MASLCIHVIFNGYKPKNCRLYVCQIFYSPMHVSADDSTISDKIQFKTNNLYKTFCLSIDYEHFMDSVWQKMTSQKCFENVSCIVGSTYIIWGKHSCPAVHGTKEVYNGNLYD